MTIAIKPIIGSNGNDQLNGGNGHELLSGRGGNDLIIAGNGHDVAYGGSGNDEIHGNSGNDTLYGSGGPSFVDLSGFTIANGTIRASHDGVVTHLKRKNPGETVMPGEDIMRLVPNKEELLIEARVRPTDIDLVWPGQVARIRLTAFNSRATPLLEGKVHWVSADRHEDAEGYYFIAEVRIDKHQLDSIPQLYLSSGMPAETILVTAKRSIAAYLFEPLLRGISRSLRES